MPFVLLRDRWRRRPFDGPAIVAPEYATNALRSLLYWGNGGTLPIDLVRGFPQTTQAEPLGSPTSAISPLGKALRLAASADGILLRSSTFYTISSGGSATVFGAYTLDEQRPSDNTATLFSTWSSTDTSGIAVVGVGNSAASSRVGIAVNGTTVSAAGPAGTIGPVGEPVFFCARVAGGVASSIYVSFYEGESETLATPASFTTGAQQIRIGRALNSFYNTPRARVSFIGFEAGYWSDAKAREFVKDPRGLFRPARQRLYFFSTLITANSTAGASIGSAAAVATVPGFAVSARPAALGVVEAYAETPLYAACQRAPVIGDRAAEAINYSLTASVTRGLVILSLQSAATLPAVAMASVDTPLGQSAAEGRTFFEVSVACVSPVGAAAIVVDHDSYESFALDTGFKFVNEFYATFGGQKVPLISAELTYRYNVVENGSLSVTFPYEYLSYLPNATPAHIEFVQRMRDSAGNEHSVVIFNGDLDSVSTNKSANDQTATVRATTSCPIGRGGTLRNVRSISTNGSDITVICDPFPCGPMRKEPPFFDFISYFDSTANQLVQVEYGQRLYPAGGTMNLYLSSANAYEAVYIEPSGSASSLGTLVRSESWSSYEAPAPETFAQVGDGGVTLAIDEVRHVISAEDSYMTVTGRTS